MLRLYKYLKAHPLQLLAALLLAWIFAGASPFYEGLSDGQRGKAMGQSYLALQKAVREAGPDAPQPACAALRARLDEAGRQQIFAAGRVKFALSNGSDGSCRPVLSVCAVARSWPEERTAVHQALSALQAAGGAHLSGVVDAQNAVGFSLALGQACPAVCNRLALAAPSNCP